MSEWAYRCCESCGGRVHINFKCSCGGDPWGIDNFIKSQISEMEYIRKRTIQKLADITNEIDELNKKLTVNENYTAKIFEFIKRTTPFLRQVLDVKLSDNGDAGKYYVVKCVIAAPDTNIPVNNLFGSEERTCLVDVAEFNKWLKGENSIKWI